MELDAKKIPLVIAHLLLTIGALVFSFLNLFAWQSDWVTLASFICFTAGLFFSIVYFMLGYKKNAALFYKLFMGSYLLGLVLTVVGNISFTLSPLSPWLSIPTTLSLVLVTMLSFGKDMGKTVSCSLCVALIVCQVIALCAVPDHLSRIPDVMLAVSASLMMLGKYYDKHQRGARV